MSKERTKSAGIMKLQSIEVKAIACTTQLMNYHLIAHMRRSI
ncbi:hypothetical protein PROVRUST_05241 [Providencia rustigianii DSM 4541]|uniref:Uncharacterized protein n=1 Tax=Providencia rustigianii DSM 4541 TaxID=500637 RepID=D1NYB5_9GAMM|nr:hypothetical protein PROVRUST_05241 [Providencia rustigianii DSM 4541]